MRTQQSGWRRWLLAAGVSLAALAVGGLMTATALARPAAAPRNTTPPTITGTPREGQTLTTSNGTWANNPTTFAYRWQRCGADGTGCVNIAGATRRTYVLTDSDVEHTIRSVVTASNADGEASAPSAPTQVVSSRDAPRNTAPPTISGIPRVGEELTATTGEWTGGVRSFDFQWERCAADGTGCVNVAGATGRTYGVRVADVGHTLRVAVTANNASGSTTVTSARTRVVTSGAPPPPPPPGVNRRPTIVLLSARLLGRRVYARFRICDDSRKNLTILERDSKPGVLSYGRRFATLTPPRPCGVYSRKWLPAPRFRTPGRYTVTLWARDKSGLTSRPVRKVLFR